MRSDRLRVASLQYFIRPVKTYEEFAAQAESWVRNAADYKAQLVVFPEYFSLQLLSLGDTRAPLPDQVRQVAAMLPRLVESFGQMARRHDILIAAGTFPAQASSGQLHNECHLFSPSGGHAAQSKVNMTRFEAEDFKVTPSSPATVRVFDTAVGRLAVAICYDVEFPELVRAAALCGAQVILVPSCTDDRRGYWRVRFCAHARTVENQLFVVQSSVVGGLNEIPAVCMHYGQSALLTPSDYGFSRDGVLAEASPNHETMVVGDLDLKLMEVLRSEGSVLAFRDSQKPANAGIGKQVEVVRL